MARNIVVEESPRIPVFKAETEIVERKGVGHPDSLMDGMAESVSRGLCRMYLERYKKILHHNTDEGEIVGGQAQPKFGGGKMISPIYVLLVGRATTEVDGERLPVNTVAVKEARNYLKRTCRSLDIEHDVIFDVKIAPGSVDLRGVFETTKYLANDTSFGVGFAPYSDTERVVLETERFINGPAKKKLKEFGEDVKVMGVRRGSKLKVTVAAAAVDRYCPDAAHYTSVKEQLTKMVEDNASKLTDLDVSVDVNTGDDPKRGVYYITVTGLSMENGDDGSVGRGNRVNGIITPYRPMSMEAAAGKNPVTHVGKLYNLLSHKISHDIAEECGADVYEVHTRIVSQIGKPIDEPQVASIQLVLAKGANGKKVQKECEAIANDWLENIDKIRQMIVNGEIGVF
ncbi:MAG TPA: methionine adenosyltransferase [Thermoplasmata archaeon]|nr:methionine adenosyltransferase [Thermoplasmata archaeon]